MNPVFLQWLCTLAIRSAVAKTTAASLQWEREREKILSCQNNEICNFSTYWVKDTHNVLSVMLSSWHLGKLHLCRGHRMLERGTSLMPLRVDRLQSLLSEPGPWYSFGRLSPGPSREVGGVLRSCYAHCFSSCKGTFQNPHMGLVGQFSEQVVMCHLMVGTCSLKQ